MVHYILVYYKTAPRLQDMVSVPRSAIRSTISRSLGLTGGLLTGGSSLVVSRLSPSLVVQRTVDVVDEEDLQQ